MEKVYPYQKRAVLLYMVLGIVLLFMFLIFLAGGTAMGRGPFVMTVIWKIFLVIFPVLSIVSFLYPFALYQHTAIREIIFSDDGMVLNRGFRPITIQKVTNLKYRKSRGKEISVTVEGLTPDGRKVRKTLMRMDWDDVNKTWEEFKKDLQDLKSQ